MVMAPVRLIVLYGGQSAEHEVSCVSAANVVRAADPERYEIRLIGITTAGQWVDATAAGAPSGALPTLPSPDRVNGDGSATVVPTALELLRTLGEGAEGAVVVLPLLHGPMGEDGTVQGLLDLAGLAYVGAGVSGSAAAMDKGMAKALLASAGLPQVRHLSARDTEIDDLWRKRVEVELGWPVFVKPANMG
ncbi:MAG: D-alanine--D-alanine ligase, partial [Acidimicrobiales bacterium]